jgi:glycerol uptake facilitator-like aquaporin
MAARYPRLPISLAVIRRQEMRRRKSDAAAKRVLWAIVVGAMIVGLISTPGQLPGESDLAYILSERSNWAHTIATIVAAFAGSPLLMLYLMEDRNNGG